MDTETGNHQLKLKPLVRVVEVTDTWILFSNGGQRHLLKTPHARAVGGLIEDFRQSPVLNKILTNRTSAEKIWIPRLLQILLKKKMIEIADPGEAGEATSAAPWSTYARSFTDSESQWQKALQKNESLSVVLATRMPEAVKGLSLAAKSTADLEVSLLQASSDDLVVLVLSSTDFGTLKNLSKISSKALILPVLLDPYGVILGPLSGGDGRPCLGCVSRRLQSNTEKLEHLDRMPIEALDEVAALWPPTFWQRLDSLLRDEIFKISGELIYSPLHRGAYLFDFLNHRSEFEEIFPISDCSCTGAVLAQIEGIE